MRREVFSIYGPFSIQSYGLAIVIGIGIFSLLFLRDQRRKALLTTDQYSSLLLVAICAGAVGGRVLAVLTSAEPFSLQELFFDGGLSVLGSIISIIGAVAFSCWRLSIALRPTLDLIALYAPVLQAVARLGCYAAGCCFGAPTNLPWAITYTDSHSLAPLHVALHPTQLYSTGLLLIIFCCLYAARSRLLSRSLMLEAYLIAISIERYVIDSLRADREWIWGIQYISAYQIICVGIVATVVSWLFLRLARTKQGAPE